MKKLRVYLGLMLFALFMGIAGEKQIFAKEWEKASLAGGASMEQAVNLPELTIVSGNVTSGQADRYYSFCVKDKVWYNIKLYSDKNLTFYLYNAKGKLLFRRTGGFHKREFEPTTWDYSADFYGNLAHGKYYIRVSGTSSTASGGKYQDAFGDYEIFTFKSIRGMEFSMVKDYAVYTGKEIPMPAITVKNAAGEVVSPKEYDIKIFYNYNGEPVSAIKEIGEYQITICPKDGYVYDEYSDSAGFPENIMYFSVKLKKAKSFRISSKKKGCIQVSAKRTKNATGCEIMISTDSKFEKNIKTYKMKTGKKAITKLKSKKRYYVKFQYYKKVEYVSRSGFHYFHYCYGDWSPVKSIVCK